MKTPIFVLLGGAFLVAVVQTQNDRITDTGKQPCPINEIPVTCKPCDRFCNKKPSGCTDTCIGGSFCTCGLGFSRISKNDRTCIFDGWCYLFAGENSTTTTTTEPNHRKKA